MFAFWVVTPCGLPECSALKVEVECSFDTLVSTTLHGVTVQSTNTYILTAARTQMSLKVSKTDH